MSTLSYNGDDQLVGDQWGRFPNGAIASAIALLAESHLLAIDAACETWDFAVEISELERLGISRGGLRWIISQKLVCHVYETTGAQDQRRTFVAAPPAGSFNSHSCLAITDAGLARLRASGQELGEATCPDMASVPSIPIPAVRRARAKRALLVPHFDAARSELSFDGQLVKRYRCPAPNQVAVLKAFEEMAWPLRLDDPLPPREGMCPKRRLSDAIKGLNRRHLKPAIRFLGDGTGEGVLWEPTR